MYMDSASLLHGMAFWEAFTSDGVNTALENYGVYFCHKGRKPQRHEILATTLIVQLLMIYSFATVVTTRPNPLILITRFLFLFFFCTEIFSGCGRASGNNTHLNLRTLTFDYPDH